MKTMQKQCVSCKKNTANQNSSVRRPKQNRLMILSIFAICGREKSRFVKNQELH